MTTKHTFISLCREYDKIEVPIIQRDYAQGRDNAVKIRKKFVDYLGSSLARNKSIQLDFIYGNIRKYRIESDDEFGEKIEKVFIPIDGQQRLTTLFLLHWYLSVKEGKLSEIRKELNKFAYETRPSSHDFCAKLINTEFPISCLKSVSKYIEDQEWFDEEWLEDGTVAGMLQMLDTISTNADIAFGNVSLDQLLPPKSCISFYFVPLEKFGLSDELYIRMNARGKILTEFENFKSEFYKILHYHKNLEEIKDKMEYSWVTNLWDYRQPKNKVFVTDECFMNFLNFISKMLYFKHAKYRDENGYAEDFLDLTILKTIYSNQKDADFLISALDIIPTIKKIDIPSFLWDNNGNMTITISSILLDVIQGRYIDITKTFVLYATFLYMFQNKTIDGLSDYVKVIRNLIYNTDDNSIREWPRIIESLNILAEGINIYENLKKRPTLLGLRNSQCDEEIFKAELILHDESAKEVINKIENNVFLKGNISNIIAACYKKSEKEITEFNINKANYKQLRLSRLTNIYNVYITLSEDDFKWVFGDLINTSLYTHQTYNSRLTYDSSTYSKNPAIMSLAVGYLESNFDIIENYLVSQEKSFVMEQVKKYDDFSQIRNVKVQLKLLYIITRRIMKQSYNSFFKYDNLNFGWLSKESGFKSLFTNGIENDQWWSKPKNNPIFQTYQWQFRYNLGLNETHTLDIETIKSGRPQKPFEKLIEWANAV